jgi:hypothetical protein
MARMVATKTALSIRVDALSDADSKSDPDNGPSIGIESRTKLESRLRALEHRLGIVSVRSSAAENGGRKQGKFEMTGNGAGYNDAADAAGSLVPTQQAEDVTMGEVAPAPGGPEDDKEAEKRAKKAAKKAAKLLAGGGGFPPFSLPVLFPCPFFPPHRVSPPRHAPLPPSLKGSLTSSSSSFPSPSFCLFSSRRRRLPLEREEGQEVQEAIARRRCRWRVVREEGQEKVQEGQEGRVNTGPLDPLSRPRLLYLLAFPLLHLFASSFPPPPSPLFFSVLLRFYTLVTCFPFSFHFSSLRSRPYISLCMPAKPLSSLQRANA